MKQKHPSVEVGKIHPTFATNNFWASSFTIVVGVVVVVDRPRLFLLPLKHLGEEAIRTKQNI
jgi:hypothetical protein